MNNFFAFIRLLRPINLLLIAATCLALRHWILIPYLGIQPIPMEPVLSGFDYGLLVAMFVLLTAAGNIINDYFDLRVDRINKPGRIVIDKYVKRRVAMAAHVGFNVAGVLIGLYLSWRVQNFLLAALPFFIAGSLWYYSVSFKKQFLIGNGVVALMAALLPLMTGLFEIPGLFENYLEPMTLFYQERQILGSPGDPFAVLWYWFLGYALLGFVLTFVREIIKDIEDIEGDEESGYKTLPILWGMRKSGLLSAGILLLTILLFGGLEFFLLEGQDWKIHAIYAACLYGPLAIALVFCLFGKNRYQFRSAGTAVKVAMLGMLVITLLFGILINPMHFGQIVAIFS